MRLFGTAADVVRASLHPCIEIGAWNMDTTDELDVDVVFHYNKWRSACVMIIDDVGSTIKKLGWRGSLSGDWRHDPAKGDTIMTLSRKIGGDFDSVDYDDPVMNRGFIALCAVK